MSDLQWPVPFNIRPSTMNKDILGFLSKDQPFPVEGSLQKLHADLCIMNKELNCPNLATF